MKRSLRCFALRMPDEGQDVVRIGMPFELVEDDEDGNDCDLVQYRLLHLFERPILTETELATQQLNL